MTDSLDDLRARLRDFAAKRDWHRFHTPKNLAMAITGEAGELAAELQWNDTAWDNTNDAALTARLGSEAADILIYLVRFADVLGLNLIDEVNQKISLNEKRFPTTGAYAQECEEE